MRTTDHKVIIENFFEPSLLMVLLEESTYGYQIIERLKDKCQCEVNIGNLYRGLSRLTKEGMVTKTKVLGSKGPDRYFYSITEDGKQLLAKWIEDLACAKGTIDNLITNFSRYHETHKSK